MNPIIQAENLSRFYGIVMGLNNVSFCVEAGMTGLVGPNGAGKTTLIRLITGQIRPSAGRLHVFGQSPWNRPGVLGRIGYCPEGDAINGELSPIDWVASLGQLSGLDKDTARERTERTLDRVGLERKVHRKSIAQFSKGMKQRVKLAQALLHEPDLLVLDEPMNGLDPMGRGEISDILQELTDQGTHILISSHILPELENLCSQFVMMNWGRVLAVGSQSSIRNDLQSSSERSPSETDIDGSEGQRSGTEESDPGAGQNENANRRWPERVTLRCDQPNRLVRILLDANLIRGFETEENSDSVLLTLLDPPDFYRRWSPLVLEGGINVYEMRSETRSLRQIFDQMTT
jgi:ABC-2 type transport system ATP-binding protein